MGSKVFLRRNVKYRKEKNYILLCDCINFIDFQLPLEYYDLLNRLAKGVVPDDKLPPEELDVLVDLNTMALLTDDPNKLSENTNTLGGIQYDEKEFF